MATNCNILNIDPDKMSLYGSALKAVAVKAGFSPGYTDLILKKFVEPGAIIKVAFGKDQSPVGFSFGFIAAAGSLNDLTQNRVDCSLENQGVINADHSGKLGIIKTVGVDPAYQKENIGTQLVNETEAELANIGATEIIVPATRVGERINIQKLLLNIGYSKWLDIPEFWKAGCDSKQFQCPDRAQMCVCSAVYFRKAPSP